MVLFGVNVENRTVDFRKIDGFTEDNNGLRVDGYDSQRLDGEIGLRGQYGIEMNGATAFLKGRVGYRHDLLDDDEDVDIRTRSGASAVEKIDPNDENAFVLGLGLGASVTQDMTFSFEYDGHYGDDVREHGVQARLRIAF